MNTFDTATTVQQRNLLVAFFDLRRFMRFCEAHTDREIFDFLADYYEFVGSIIEDSGGKVVKFIGDAGLIVYDEPDVNRGVLALRDLQKAGDAWLAEREVSSHNVLKLHFGPVICGPAGTRSDKRFDVLGSTVNTAAVLRSNGFAMTPQVFRQLDTATRKLFKKHTPPVRYIPVEERHRD